MDMRTTARVVTSVMLLASTLLIEPLLSATPQVQATATIRDGVYTATQAARGRVHFENICSRCHGVDLSGGVGRALAGDAFIRDWGGLTLESFYERAQTMPPGAPSSLSDDAYLDIITYVLEANNVPAGAVELEPYLLGDILIEGEGGPGEVLDFSLVQVVGCLSRDANGDWIVTDASDPIRTRDPTASTGDALNEVNGTALGTTSFQLMYVFPDPAAYDGHRVETKGFLIREPQNALNVTVVASLGSTCISP